MHPASLEKESMQAPVRCDMEENLIQDKAEKGRKTRQKQVESSGNW